MLIASSIVALAISYQAPAAKQAQLADGVHALGVINRITLETPGGYYGAAYDSDKGEIFVPNSEHGTVSVISDSSVTSASPSPTVPELSGVGLILVAVAMIVVTMCAVAWAVRKSTRTNSDSKQKTK